MFRQGIDQVGVAAAAEIRRTWRYNSTIATQRMLRDANYFDDPSKNKNLRADRIRPVVHYMNPVYKIAGLFDGSHTV